MNRAFSLYLDFLRAGAALVVFLTHGRFTWFSQGITWLPSLGHEMVIIFFVLSGYVIAQSTGKGGKDGKVYASDRLSRLYSVVIPALLLTVCLDQAGSRIAPALYADLMAPDHYLIRIGLAGLFVQQCWTLSSIPGSNAPFWSLAYEFWYYALFGLFSFCRRPLWLFLGTLAWVALLGWKIPLLLPVWLLGCGAFWLGQRRPLSPATGGIVALGSGTAFLASALGYVSLPGAEPHWVAQAPLFFSGHVAVDLQMGLLMAAHLYGMSAWLSASQSDPTGTLPARAIRFIANRSFTLYLIHLPVLAFVRAVIPFDGKSDLQVALVMGLAGTFILLIAGPIEHSRFYLRRHLDRLLGVVRPVKGG